MSSPAADSNDFQGARPESPVELPEDVGSETSSPKGASSHRECEEAPKDADDVSLPDSIASSDGPLVCCKLQCMKHQDIENVKLQIKTKLENVDDNTSRMDKIYEQVKILVEEARTNNVRFVQWQVDGWKICRVAWQKLHTVSPKTVDNMRKLVAAGHKTLPPKMKVTVFQPKAEFMQADAFFLKLYNNLAEPMAVGLECSTIFVDEPHEVVDSPDHPLWSISLAVPGEPQQRLAPRRFLNPGSIAALYAQFQSEAADKTSCCSKSTFERCWKHWKKYLRFRNIGQGSRCKTCSRLDKERAEAVTAEDRQGVEDEKTAHIQLITNDRAVNVRGNLLAAQHAQACMDGSFSNASQRADSLWKLQIDGMDQAKFKMPRNICASAEFSSLRRPTLHVTGIVLHGWMEAFFLLPSDCAKDANMNASLVCRLVDLFRERFPDEYVARNLIVSADNTPRESKNQWFGSMLAALVGKGMWDSIELQFLQTSHSHNELDQRFSSISALLERASVLEDADEVKSYLEKMLQPAGGRKHVVIEIVPGCWDFQSLFAKNCGMKISGLTSTHLQPYANHVWRFCKRKMLSEMGLAVENSHEDWMDCDDPNDVCLLLKQFMSSAEQSQAPILMMPSATVAKISPELLAPAPLVQMSETEIKEFQKTAEGVAKEPWKLFKAQAFLQDMCNKNQAGLVDFFFCPYHFKRNWVCVKRFGSIP